ncbi:MAG: hypothetical protein ACI9WU_004763, partial [Myxococcota bacterium]
PAGSVCAPSEVASPDCFAGTCTAEGTCDALPLTNTACDDLDACTLSEACNAGTCQGTPVECDDGDDCTTDSCDAATGLCTATTAAPGSDCQDGNPCTVGDVCGASSCDPGQNFCPCTVDADCPDDGNACNGTLVCGDSGCETLAGSAVDCDGSDDTVCMANVCVSDTGACHVQPKTGAGCDDGEPCTFSDGCDEGGTCVGAPQICDDDSVCTDDACIQGTCVFTPNNGACNDGDGCTTDDVCAGHICQGQAAVCDDGNACTADSCQNHVCHFTPFGGICDDGNACTISDECIGGICKGTDTGCDDDNSCTADSCDVAAGCNNAPVAGACSDGDACTTGDTCQQGECASGSSVQCPQGGACDAASCDPTEGCQLTSVLDLSGCDDLNACTQGEVCIEGACGGGDTICECTNDAACDDGDPCNGVETCSGPTGSLTCQEGTAIECAVSGDPCSHNICNATSGLCEATDIAEGLACGLDDSCQIDKVCQGGSCTGTSIPCPDQACWTVSGCDADAGCLYAAVANGTSCNDGDPCTIKDSCSGAGDCGGTADDCDDNNSCTADTCSATEGCIHTQLAKGTACDTDNNLCTPDTCNTTGNCKAAEPTECDDGVSCTNDGCDPGTGQCVFAPDHSQCVDTNSCTSDVCSATGCKNTGANDFTPCEQALDGAGPDICFQGECTSGVAATVAPQVIFCAITQVTAPGLTADNGAYYLTINYKQQSFSLATGCNGEALDRVQVGKLKADGAYAAIATRSSATATAMAGRVVVGQDGLVGYIASDTEVQWEGALQDKLEGSGAGALDFGAVGFVRTAPSLTSNVDNYLFGGRTKTNGLGVRCDLNKSGWDCSEAETTGVGNTLLDFRGATLFSVLNCPSIPCIFNTVVGGGWLGSASTDTLTDFLEDGDGSGTFAGLPPLPAGDFELAGAVQESAGVVWFFGAKGKLHRCENSACAEISLNEEYEFVDAFAYGGGVVFLASTPTAVLVSIAVGQDPIASNFLSTTLEGLKQPTAISGTVTDGIRVVGRDSSGTKLSARWFFK